MHLLKGLTTGFLLMTNITMWGILVAAVSLGRLIPFSRHLVISALEWIVTTWASWNERIIDMIHPDLEWRINLEGDLRKDRNYLVISNHISWLDVLAVQRALLGEVPFLRFFLKEELRWAPIVGLTAWALEMPFMKRYSPEYLERHPEQRGRDLEATRHATRRFGERPSSILSYIEGTRFTDRKHAARQSRWKWLLPPKLGGISYVVGVLGDRLHSLIDVTVTYPARRRIFWKLLSGQLDSITVDVREIPIPPELKTPAILESEELRDRFRFWIHGIWDEKEQQIGARHQVPGASFLD